MAHPPAKKITLWRKWLSYLQPQIIALGHSEYSGHLELSLSSNRFMLSSNNAVYSFEDLYHNFADAFRLIKIEQYTLKNVLVLGMGLGSVAQMLVQKHGHNQANYTLVEIDPLIIEWAKTYTLPKLKQGAIEIIARDAYTYILQSEAWGKYDLIVIDVFVDDLIPENLQTIDFLEKIKMLVAEKGIVLFNCLYAQLQDKRSTEAFYKEKFARVFQQHRVLDVTSNWILMATV